LAFGGGLKVAVEIGRGGAKIDIKKVIPENSKQSTTHRKKIVNSIESSGIIKNYLSSIFQFPLCLLTNYSNKKSVIKLNKILQIFFILLFLFDSLRGREK
jgi:hypothetical protein